MEEDKEAECDGGLCAAGSSVSLTLAHSGRRTERNINGFTTHVEQSLGKILPTLLQV